MLMGRTRKTIIKKLYPNAPKRIICRLCKKSMRNTFLDEGFPRSLCPKCLSKIPKTKVRKTRSDKGKKRSKRKQT